MKETILVFGSCGMAGHMICEYLSEFEDYEILRIARDRTNPKTNYYLDVTSFFEIQKLIEEIKPIYVINAIGILNKESENNPDKSILINSYFPHFLAKICNKVDCSLIHISTDCVFNGKRGFYNEHDFKDGIGFYAQTKALGEVHYEKNITIRTSIIGPELKKDGIGLFNWIFNQKKCITGYSNAYWGGVTTLELAKAIHFIIKQKLINLNLVHLTNNERISKYDLIKIISNIFSLNFEIISSEKYKIDKSLKNTNPNFIYEVPTYPIMIKELYNWMLDHKSLYTNYKIH